MFIKLTDQGKNHIADVLSGLLLNTQQLIEDYIKNIPAKNTDGSIIDFSQPHCHLIIKKRLSSSSLAYDNFQIIDSLCSELPLDSHGRTYFKACLIYPVESRGSVSQSAFDIVANGYPRLVPDVLRPAIKNYLESLGRIGAYASCGLNTSNNAYKVFADAGLPYTPESYLYFSVSFTMQLDKSEYT